MPKKRLGAEQIVTKLLQIEVLHNPDGAASPPLGQKAENSSLG